MIDRETNAHLFGVLKALALSASIIATSGAIAQVTAGPASGGAPAPAGDIAATEDVPAEAFDIVVTGSRIARRDYAADSPVISLNEEALKSVGAVALEGKLNQLPQFAAAGTGFTTTVAGTGQANLNLRGLGTSRTLVLLDGRRVQAASSALVIDLNTIPAALIGDVEVITGGASAVYGSDAIAGVVNLKTRRNFTGLQLDAQTNITERGDGRAFTASALGGAKFADDRGSVLFSLEYYDRGKVYNRDRSFYSDAFTRGGGATASNNLPTGTYTPGTNAPSQAALNALFAKYGFSDTIARTTVLGFNNDGSLFTDTNGVRNFRGSVDGTGYTVTSGGALFYDPNAVQELVSPLTRYSGYFHADYKVTDSITLYSQAMFTSYKGETNGSGPLAQGVWTLSVPVTNPFIPTDLKTLLASRAAPNDNFSVLKRFNQLGDRRIEHDFNVFQLLAGANGPLGIKDWTWDLYSSYGRTTITDTTVNGGTYLSLLQRLISAPDGGASLCSGGLNLFGDQPISASCATYLRRTVSSRTSLSQHVVEGTLQGSLFTLPAGDMRFAAGASYRRNVYSFTPDAILLTNPTDLLSANPATPTNGATTVKEIYGELLVPVLRDLPLIKKFEVDLAYRYSDYNVSGGIHTYKATADWNIFGSFSVRGGYQRAVRAPNVGELFQGIASANNNLGQVPNGGDPCDVRSSYRTGASGTQVRALCQAQGISAATIDSYQSNFNQVASITGGNLGLKPEKADTLTLGAVWQPRISVPALRNISLSVDYYNIKITDVINTLSPATILYNCFNASNSNPSFSNANVYCSNITRNADGTIFQVAAPYLNLGGYKTSGIDVQADWRIDLDTVGLGEKAGSLGINVAGTYLEKFLVQNLLGAPFVDYAGTIGSGTPYPKWKSVTTLTYSNGPVRFGGRWQHLDGMKHITAVTTPALPSAPTPSYNTFDLFGSVDVNKRMEIRFGIDNVGDKTPLIVGGIPGTTDPGTYDPLGRRFYLATRLKF